MKILVIDDESMICQLAEKILLRGGHEVLISEDGSGGVSLLAEVSGGIDAAIIDWQLPDITGLEVVTRLREIKPDLTCILSSGNTLKMSDIPETLRPNTFFLAKPYRSNELTDLINQIARTATE